MTGDGEGRGSGGHDRGYLADRDRGCPADPDRGYAADRLRLLSEPGPPGPARRAALAARTDRWLAGLAERAARESTAGGWALLAVGGYGRGELSPRSDLDLVLLHDGRGARGGRGAAGPGGRTPIAALADRFWYPVWDLGLDLDHSVRTPAEALAAAAADLRVQLGLLDARHLAGDAELTAALRGAVLADWRDKAAERLPALRELCAERAARQGELSCLLEPDLKEARGGLRDATALRAVAASWLADAPREGLDRARTLLLDTRDALHLSTGRATDRLALQEQDQVAAALGVPDADALLRGVYQAARRIAYAADVTWREVGLVLRARGARARRRAFPGRGRTPATGPAAGRVPLAEGVVEQEGEAVLALAARPERDAVLPLRAAAAAAQAGLPLSPHAVRRLAATAAPLPVPWPAEAREQLVTLLGAGAPAVAVWEALEAGGLVSRLLPEWERVRCLPQRNAVHRFTVDRHLVETAVRAAGLTRRVERPDLLLTAALLHDIGKGLPGDHSAAGEPVARAIATRIGFRAADADTIALLVRHHLLLIDTATRRDLDDPQTVRAVAAVVRDTATLDLLAALTEADALATGPAAWSTWRASLLADLVTRVAGALDTGALPGAGERGTTKEEEHLAAEAARSGGPVLVLRAGPPPVAPPPAGSGRRDATASGAREGVPPGGRTAASGGRDGVRPDGRNTASGGRDTEAPGGRDGEADAGPEQALGAELLLAVPDRPGLLPDAAGVLALHRLTVHAADLRRADPVGGAPVALLTWRVSAQYGELPEAARLRADLARAFGGTLDIAGRLAEREAARPRRRGAAPAPPRVTVAPARTSRTATVIEVRAQDAPGLLHRIGLALSAAGVTVRSARVSTLGANAVDAFYVVGADGRPLPADRAEDLAGRLAAALR